MNDRIMRAIASILKKQLETIERYDMKHFNHCSDLFPSEDGDWVRYADVLKLLGLPDE